MAFLTLLLVCVGSCISMFISYNEFGWGTCCWFGRVTRFLVMMRVLQTGLETKDEESWESADVMRKDDIF